MRDSALGAFHCRLPSPAACSVSSFRVPSSTSSGPIMSKQLSTSCSGSHVAHGAQAVDHVAHAGEAGIAEPVGHEVDAGHERAAVDPLLACMPSLNAGRIQQVLPHIGGLHGEVANAGSREGGPAHHAEGTHDDLGRAS